MASVQRTTISHACPEPEGLVALLSNRLPELEKQCLLAHLDTCPGCEHALETLTAEDETWADYWRGACVPAPCEQSQPAPCMRS